MTPTTLRWFGQPWGAPLNDPELELEVPTPIGVPCAVCGALIAPDDSGITLPLIPTGERIAYHTACFARALGI